MKNIHKLVGIILSFVMISFMSGCGGSSSSSDSSTGTVVLSLTDAPIDYDNVTGVYITFVALRYQYAEDEDNWEDIDLTVPRTINLLELQDGRTTLLNQVDLPAGDISHIRFVLDIENSFITFTDGTDAPLEVSSGEQTGYKAIGGFTIPAGGTVQITADFDAEKSVTATGNGRYLLNPTIKIFESI